MKLKKLELTGFKSFSDKSAIEFPAGISAVVGPNGCGKSNIVDAIRWVMGEQSVKQLRGKSMEDIIFSGTNGKPPLNMAEVSLTLANDDGTAPEELKDFTEIMITRRLYRSGERAYFLNRQPCRLKDIHNIFLGSGMGAKSYAVIQQGNIGAITEAGPDERRIFIEEAAGITRYKTRKTEALRKVQATNQNLTRLTDIINEIKRQMASLKRQAQKAERFKNYQVRIRALDIRLGLHYFIERTEQIRDTKARLETLKDELIGYQTELKRIDAQMESIKLQRTRKMQEISDKKTRNFELQRTLDKKENDLQHLKIEVERLSGEISELNTARIEVGEKNEKIVSEINQVERQTIEIQTEINTVSAAIEHEKTASQSNRTTVETLTQSLETSKKKLMELVAQEARIKNIFQNASRNKESLQRRLRRVDEEEALARQNCSYLKNKEDNAREDRALLNDEIVGIDEQVAGLQEALDSLTRQLGHQAKCCQDLELKRKEIASKYSALKKMEDNFEWYKGGVKAVMQRFAAGNDLSPNSEPASGILGLMADVIEPAPSYETAVEAALGEILQYVIVRDQNTGQMAIEYLQQSSQGRSGFIPVSSIKIPDGDLHAEIQAEDLLVNHVSVRPGFKAMVGALFGHVVVTETLDQAVALYNRSKSPLAVVTKAGERICHQGLMLGGGPENQEGILSKKKEIKDLERNLSEIARELEGARTILLKTETEIGKIESALQEKSEFKRKTMEELTEAEKTLFRATENLKHARRQLEIIRLEQEQLMGESSDLDEELVKHNQAVSDIEKKVQEEQERVASTTREIKSVSSKIDEYNRITMDLQLKLTSFEAKLENSSNTLKRLKEFQKDGIHRFEQLKHDITLKTERRIVAGKKITEYTESINALHNQHQATRRDLEETEGDYRAIDSRIKENDQAQAEIQTKRESANEKIRTLEVELSQLEIKRENIENRLKERYHKPISELQIEIQSAESDTASTQLPIEEMETELDACRKKAAALADVNLGAIREYEELKERHDFLEGQQNDLINAIDDLHKVIRKINKITQEKFIGTFNLINEKLNEVFPRLFNGGGAKLTLTEPDKPLDSGVEFMIHPPGKKLTRLSLLSGGEKALSAIAFIFAIFLIKPASFCLLDEIDAPLDESNVFRFNNLLKIIGEKSQIVMITHNKRSMEFADTLFGVTMERKGVSKIVSVNFEHAETADAA